MHTTRTTARRFCLALALAATPAVNWAWGPDGHQAVGAIADQLLAGSRAQQQVQQILGGLPLRQAALWADCAKGVSSPDGVVFNYTVAKNANGSLRYPECQPFETPAEEARQKAFAARNWKQCGTAHGSEYCHNQYHYTDVSELRDRYDEHFKGTQPHDVVHAIGAAIAVLRGQPSPAPMQFADAREALLVLSHYVGDIHQPLHVEAVYLDAQGHEVDPDASGLDPKTDTAGGNALLDGSAKLHGEWDAIPSFLQVDGSGFQATLAKARTVAPSGGGVDTWPAQWATDTLVSGKLAFQALSYTLRPPTSPAAAPSWTVHGVDARYKAHADVLKGEQLAKAGARLAQVLMAVWPDAGPTPTPVCAAEPPHPAAPAYLPPGALPNPLAWLPPAPGGRADKNQAADDDAIAKTRPLLKQPRGQQAAEDDVFLPEALAQRFKTALGAELNHCNAPRLMQLIERAQADATALLAPVKRPVADGGRPRPFVAKPSLATCLSPVDLAGKRHDDLDVHHLDRTGSYPSGHAQMGLFLGLLLTDLAPDRGSELLAWGMAFGDSRVICGFHYPSDVTAGRLTAAALWSRLLADPVFAQDLEAARGEVAAARGH